MSRLAIPSAKAWSVPGCTGSHQFALSAKNVGRGSTTINFTPRFIAFCTSTKRANHVLAGLWPQRSMQSVPAKSSAPISVPNVSRVAKSLYQLQISVPQIELGPPYALTNLSIHEMQSEICVPLGVVIEKTTCCTPWSARLCCIWPEISSNALSQEIYSQIGS